MMLYEYDSNTILTKPLKKHTTQEFLRGQTRLNQYLLDRGLKSVAFRIDNKCPKALQSFFRANSVNLQICPPNEHQK